MEMSGQYTIPLPQKVVWEGLNDAEILARAITGAETVKKVSSTQYEAVVQTKIGPVRARFTGKITLSEINPPHSYTITGEGDSGGVGFAKGQAIVLLETRGDATIFSYKVTANVGGKIAQIGQRFIDSVAEKMARDFFTKFIAALQDTATVPSSCASKDAAASPVAPVPTKKGVPAIIWLPGMIAILAVSLWLSIAFTG